jgi:hypothetical protein
MDLNLTHDEDDGGNDDDDFGQNRPRIAATLRAFWCTFGSHKENRLQHEIQRNMKHCGSMFSY